MTNSRTAIDLFSGCGGLSQGLKQAGFQMVACAEIRPEAREAYALNHPNTFIHEDIRKIQSSELLKTINLKEGELDLLAACPPCQGFSSIRTKNGEIAKDPRNDLIFEVARLAKDLLPKVVLIENVPRLLTDYRIEQFKNILKEVGYEFSGGVLDAQYFGVPQRRKRMILIGSRFGEFGLPTPTSRKFTVKDALKNLPDPEGEHKRPLHRIRQKLSPIVLERIKHVKKNRSELPEHLQLNCHKRYQKGFRDVYGRMSWNEVAPTITRSSHNPSKGRYIHPSQNRGITIYEAMLLQGFPRSYKLPPKFGIGKLSSMIGEALPPPLGKAQGIHILKILSQLEKAAK